MDFLHKNLAPLMDMVQTQNVQFPATTKKLLTTYETAQSVVNNFYSNLDSIDQQLKDLVSQVEVEYLSRSYDLYEQGLQHDTVDHILQRRFVLDQQSTDFILGRLRLYGDWRRPGMIIRPGLESWIDHLVPLDPLYLVDHDHELLRPGLDRFRLAYQSRLRPYVIKDSMQQPMMDKLPEGQMGFIFCYNFFHYKPLEYLKVYFNELFAKLAPGGVLAMTFNDCDRPGGVQLTERYFMCYTAGSTLLALAQSIGYEVGVVKELNAATTWIELCKPGKRTSLRGGQALAKVMHQPRRKKKS